MNFRLVKFIRQILSFENGHIVLGQTVCVHMKTNIVDQIELLCLLTLSHVMSSRPKEVQGRGIEKRWYSEQIKK